MAKVFPLVSYQDGPRKFIGLVHVEEEVTPLCVPVLGSIGQKNPTEMGFLNADSTEYVLGVRMD